MKVRTLLLLWLAVTVLGSCVHREFDYESSDVVYLDVVFDWLHEPDANPGSMSLYLYPRGVDEPLRFDFGGRDGGTIRLEPGLYDAICVNSDRRGVFYRGTTFATFELTTEEATALTFGSALSVNSWEIPRAGGTENQSMATQPPLLWGASESEVAVKVMSSAKNRSGNQELRMYPRRCVDTYQVEVKRINNIKHLSALSATISDMSESHRVADHVPAGNGVTLPMELNHNPVDSTAMGRFLTFGHCPDGRRAHRLMIYAILTDDSKYYFEFDVSDQAHKPPDADNVHHITVELLDLPASIGGGGSGGLVPSVDDWTNINIGLEM